MSQFTACRALVGGLADAGVRDVCISPGSRSTPLALAFTEEKRIRAWVHLDERSGSFFGLGIAKAARRPVALVCTSGTAAAEFLPAVIEAHHAQVPLIVVTADRPPELLDAGAGQTIDQLKLYGSNVRWFHQLDGDTDPQRFAWVAARAVATATATPPGPVHLNVALRDPLTPTEWTSPETITTPTVFAAPPMVPSPETIRSLAERLAPIERGLIVCGPHDGSDSFAQAAADLASTLSWPLLADGASQLRTSRHTTIDSYDALLRTRTFADTHLPQAVVRFGIAPISKALNAFLANPRIQRHVLVDPNGAWSDPNHRATHVVAADEESLATLLAKALPRRAESSWARAWSDANQRARAATTRALSATDELFEGRVFSELADLLPDGSTLYVGNSMPIRDLDSFFPGGRRTVRVLANRGASGIDGFLSSGLGAAAVSEGPVVIAIGDLALQHDLGGLAAIKRHNVRATILLLNNDGGGIFSFLPQAKLPTERFEQLFGTPQGLDVAQVAQLFGLDHRRVQIWKDFSETFSASLTADRATIIEVPSNRTRNVELHQAVWDAVTDAEGERT